ncbi:MAG: alanine racemase [Deltaproteobacteria bacterium]|nr:alanine racemase [Deltaproteobacteria bacterium]
MCAAMIASPNRVIIDLSALAGNLRQIRNLVGRDTRIMGVVKSDAYGHGLLEVGRVLERNGIDCLGVAYLHEALALREGGVRLPVVILCGIRTREESRHVLENGLTPVLFDLSAAEILSQECRSRGLKTRIHLKVDTGMGRLGIADTEIGPFIQKVISFKHLEIEALTTHLATADETDARFTEDQIARFEMAIFTGRSLGLNLTLNNMANSAGIIGHRRTLFDMVRPGVMLYGGRPSPGFFSTASFAPVMHLRAEVVQVRDLPDKTPVSYGRTYHTKGPRRVAVLSAGYADGLPRTLSNRGKVLVGGKMAGIIGTVCMNLTVCDITGHKDVSPGDPAVFLGSQGEECITGDDIAKQAGTISYEIFCAIGPKNLRTYIK